MQYLGAKKIRSGTRRWNDYRWVVRQCGRHRWPAGPGLAGRRRGRPAGRHNWGNAAVPGLASVSMIVVDQAAAPLANNSCDWSSVVTMAAADGTWSVARGGATPFPVAAADCPVTTRSGAVAVDGEG